LDDEIDEMDNIPDACIPDACYGHQFPSLSADELKKSLDSLKDLRPLPGGIRPKVFFFWGEGGAFFSSSFLYR
jgi:hypothetical protein